MNFKQSILVSSSKEKAYKAVTLGISNWWGNVSNSVITKIGDEFTVFFEAETEWRFKVVVLSKFDEVSWKCISANHGISDLKGKEEEWLNSEIIFKFRKYNFSIIEIFFEHKGLTPELHCYKICVAGWTHFISNSLKQYLETGKGLPNLIG